MSDATAIKPGLSPLNNRLITILLSVVLAGVVLMVLFVVLVMFGRVSHGVSHHVGAPVGTVFGTGTGPSSNALVVRFTPNPPRLHSSLAVHVSGLSKGEGLRFVFNRIPKTDAFGGPMGTFYANSRGRLHFTYPTFHYTQERGLWEMIAYRSNGLVAVRKTFRLIG